MLSDNDIIASFSPDSRTFAFRSNGLQRKYVDLYPLSEANDYKVSSSLVSHIDYESGDLKLEDLKFTTWCLANAEDRNSSGKTKRKLSEPNADSNSQAGSVSSESYFVNVFTGGKIVVFSPTGKEIVNIIQNKREILGLGASGSTLWILDDEKTVKHFDYRSSKPLKTFHLVDGKNDDISNFQVLEWQDKVLLAVFTPTNLYIVDPSKRRPSTVVNMDLPMGKYCVPGAESQLIVAGSDSVHIVELKTGKAVSKWRFQASQLKFWQDRIYGQSVDGIVSVFEVGNQKEICSIKCQSSKIIHFTFVDSNIIIAWLNVNEPKFEHLTSERISKSHEIVFHQEKDAVTESNADAELETTNTNNRVPEKVSTKSKDKDIITVLLRLMDDKSSSTEILHTLASESWSEAQIKEVVSSNLADEHAKTVFSILSNEISQNPWSTGSNCALWYKWLLTLCHSSVAPISDNRSNKNLKQVRSSLRQSSDVYSLLLSMKGKLEMLSEQAKLREEFANVSLDAEDYQFSTENDETKEQEPIYANGEGDEFVDALDYTDPSLKVSGS
ncbi:LANO_0B01068g1_1 [Lachancea nothofagi CBS 11611]|uniref:LANO_0B01068g1_1 n=1 Tax=Lachancea nothofagi CBS 11611 TaxID=1266666 RepID=A0A1G4IUZ6_9SACH|nr:LANO_0B01068g1_1 [Lachancea nothofagi CBS 11611]